MNMTKEYSRGTVVFREGETGNSMYNIDFGKVGVYRGYGTKDEKQIAELDTDKVFGEMSLLDHAPRSATVVVLEDHTLLSEISEEDFYEFFEKNPMKLVNIMTSMCNRLRKTTQDYKEACHTVYDAVETEKKGEEKSKSLVERINDLCEFYSTMSYYPYFD